MVPNVAVDLDTVNMMSDGIGTTFSFTLNWGVPFANFDPIQNYMITIGCDGSECPVTLTTDNVTTSLDVSYTTIITNVTITVAAINSLGTSDPAMLEVASMCTLTDVIKTHGSESRGQERAKRIAKNKTRNELPCVLILHE